ncbi:PQQ-dependent sugar dehydrogenase [Haladaptatus sp. DYF46]|uniref:PQQ-dependent sugar dehydrogenase n=1 Tax=Haladaptatus sp. DYF46 TaxID=2886041 RepID=UPI001E4A1466|nr:PQQ-dependent sugar dehydrogenase [Haladaptatus sp. DYF46]
MSGFSTTVQAQQTTLRFGGRVQGWQGRAPQRIKGKKNPTLNLQPGKKYKVVWENLDGQPHDFAIQDSNGNTIKKTPIVSQQGATRSLTFTATEKMAQYICTVHPTTMVGQMQVGKQTGNQQNQQQASFFEQGTRVGVQKVAGGMTAPTDFAVASEQKNRQFVTDQTGEIWVIGPNGRQKKPFLDVSDRMVTLGKFAGTYADPNQSYDERGLLGLEFHPDFQNNRKFYVHYSAPRTNEMPKNWDHIEVVSEFKATKDLSSGDPNSERKLLQIEKPQYNHDGGPMAFGPDGHLYVPMGDGGGANDDMYGHVSDWYQQNKGGNGQDVSQNLLGNILRIDVDSRQGGKPYGIPNDNPLVDKKGRDEIYAWGFRNPFGISFDSQNNLFVADAGQNLYEEADIVKKGGNYGWNVKEGTHCFSTKSATSPPKQCPSGTPKSVRGGEPFQNPILEFPHTYENTSVGITIVGGHRYENSTISGLQGKYVYGVWTEDPARAKPAGRLLTATPPQNIGKNQTKNLSPSKDEIPRQSLWKMEELQVDGQFNYFVRMFGRDSNGELYVLANKRGAPEGNTGVVLKLVPPGR